MELVASPPPEPPQRDRQTSGSDRADRQRRPAWSISPTSPSASIRPSSTSRPPRAAAAAAGAQRNQPRSTNPARSAESGPGPAAVGQRVRDRRRRTDPDELSRHPERRADHGEVLRRPQPAGARARHRSRHRYRADQGRGEESAGRAAGRFGDAASGRVGVRDRQSARVRAHRDRRSRQLSRAEAVRHQPRQLHTDRRGDQFRQQRRAAHQRPRRGGRHQLGDQPAGEQHRLRRADQRGAIDSAAAQKPTDGSRAGTWA